MDQEAKDLLPKVAKLGWEGYQQIGRGALFFGEGEDYPLYIKQGHARQMTVLNEKQQSLIAERMNKYDPNIQVVVFYEATVLLFDIFKATGKNCEDFLKSLKKPKPIKSSDN